jgi:hypothetical protein
MGATAPKPADWQEEPLAPGFTVLAPAQCPRASPQRGRDVPEVGLRPRFSPSLQICFPLYPARAYGALRFNAAGRPTRLVARFVWA